MKYILFIILLLMKCNSSSLNQQEAEPFMKSECPGLHHQEPTLAGGPCEGCEAVFEFGKDIPSPVDTLPDFGEEGPKLQISGTIYKKGGHEPACDVILYVYHTDQTGVYPTKGNEEGWARRHGYIRGWIKTDEDGKYTFYTLKPGSYPAGTEPAHIHITVLEPDGTYYYIDDFLFEGDPLLSSRQKASRPRRGGNGILNPASKGKILVATRNIELGKNVPEYE